MKNFLLCLLLLIVPVGASAQIYYEQHQGLILKIGDVLSITNVSWVNTFTNAGQRNNVSGTIGCEFQAKSNITLTALGRLTVDPANFENHPIGLWNTNGVLLASNTVVPNNSIGWIFVPVTPVNLIAGQFYRMGSAEGADFWADATTFVTTKPDALLTVACYDVGAFLYPSANGPNNAMYVGMDFRFYPTPPPLEWVTNFVTGSTRSDEIVGGCSFKVGSKNITVTELGRWNVDAANTLVHQIGLWDNSGVLLASNSISAAGGYTGWKYVSIAPVTLNAGQVYRINATEGGDSWLSIGSVSTTTDAAILIGACYTYGPTLAFPNNDYTPDTQLSGMNFRYHY